MTILEINQDSIAGQHVNALSKNNKRENKKKSLNKFGYNVQTNQDKKSYSFC